MTISATAAPGTGPRRRVGRLRIWWEGLRIGLHTITTYPILGLKRLVLPVSYWRVAEFAYVWSQLDLAPGSRVLDLGSPKELAYMLARNSDVNVVATDILSSTVKLSKRYADAQRLSGSGPGRVRSEVQDGRDLGYPDASFDAAYSVSVLEHIPDDGDGAALRELVRVVKPGGRIVVTVPYDDVAYREDWLDEQVYERRQLGNEPVFYQRHYDEQALRERLLDSTSAQAVDVVYWGEGRFAAEAFLDGSALRRRLLSPLEPLLSILFLKKDEPPGRAKRRKAAFATLQM